MAKKLLRGLILFLPIQLFAVVCDVDYFNRPSVQTRWTALTASFATSNNVALKVSSSDTSGLLYRNDCSPGGDQYTAALIDAGWGARNGGARGGIALRIDSAASTGYACAIVAENGPVYRLRIIKLSPSPSTLVETSPAVATVPQSGDLLTFSISGNTKTCSLFQGITATPRLDAVSESVDSAFATGKVGFYAFTQNVEWDDWHGKDLSGTTPLRTWTCDPCFVSPTALPEGIGTEADPLPFDWRLNKTPNNPTTTWLRGGTYNFDITKTKRNISGSEAFFTITHNGTSSTVRDKVKAYSGEKVILDVNTDCSASFAKHYALISFGTFGDVEDIDLRNSGDDCKMTCGGYNSINGWIPAGEDVTCINCIIRDILQGVTGNSSLHSGFQLRDSIIKNYSRRSASGCGTLFFHGAYTHTNDLTKQNRLVNNMFLQQMTDCNGALLGTIYSWQHYSQGGEELSNTYAIGNIMAKSGGMYLSGGSNAGVLSDITYDNNRVFNAGLQIQAGNSTMVQNLKVINNHLHGSGSMGAMGGGTSQFTGNFIAGSSTFLINPNGGQQNISSLTIVGATATVTTATGLLGLINGDSVTISSTVCTVGDANGVQTVTVTGTKTFTYTTAAVGPCTVVGATALGPARFDTFDEFTPSGWNNNTLNRVNSSDEVYRHQILDPNGTAANKTLAQIQAMTGSPDASSTVNTTTYPAFGFSFPDANATNYIRVSRSEDDTFKHHLAVYNYKGLSSGLNYDPSSNGFSTGDRGQITDAQCLECGPVLRFKQSGNIDLGPYMGLTTIDTVLDQFYTADPDTHCDPTIVGDPTPAFTHTTNEFGTFIVERDQTRVPSVLTTYNNVPNSARVVLLSGPDASHLNFPKRVVACTQGNVCRIPVSFNLIGKTFYQLRFEDSNNALLKLKSIRQFDFQ